MNEKNIASSKNYDVSSPKMYLSATDTLKIHTNIGQNLINGDWRIGKMGLIQFASLMTILQKATREDDPYAKWYLYKTFDALNKMQEKLQCYETSIHEQLSTLRGFEIEIYYNPTPLNQPLNFSTALANIAARLIEKIDYLTRLLYTLKRHGLLPKHNITIKNIIIELQSIFALPRAWHYTGVTNKDITVKSMKAQHAENKMGKVPGYNLKDEILLSLMPKVKKNLQSNIIIGNTRK